MRPGFRIRWRRRAAPDEAPSYAKPLRAPDGLDPYRDPPAASRHRSAFGGLWTDVANARDVVQGKRALGAISEEEQHALECWIEKGYVVLPRAVPETLADRVRADLESIWLEGHPQAWINAIEDGRGTTRRLASGDHRKTENLVKLLDAHAFCQSAREAVFAPLIQRFLELVFERPPLAHQSLAFYRGSKQPIHRDTAFVRVSSPMELAASWIALEDVAPGAGELEYYEGSHRFEEYLFEGKYKWMPPGSAELGRYYESIHAEARARGIEPSRFRPRKGDALIWSADLAHGGSEFCDASRTRRSLVTHYCPVSVDPMYFYYGGHSEKIRWRERSYYCYVEHVPWRAG